MRYLFDSREWNFVRNFVTGRANYTSDEWRSDFRGFIEARNMINFTLSNHNEFWLNFLIIIIIENCVKQLFEKKNTFIILKFLANSIKDNINKEWLEQYKYKYQFICFNDYFYKVCKVQNNSFPWKNRATAYPFQHPRHIRVFATRGDASTSVSRHRGLDTSADPLV